MSKSRLLPSISSFWVMYKFGASNQLNPMTVLTGLAYLFRSMRVGYSTIP
jgi:hypothetical protein